MSLFFLRKRRRRKGNLSLVSCMIDRPFLFSSQPIGDVNAKCRYGAIAEQDQFLSFFPKAGGLLVRKGKQVGILASPIQRRGKKSK
jgi:hypothetical protein